MSSDIPPMIGQSAEVQKLVASRLTNGGERGAGRKAQGSR